jgi:sulfate/thiosulfate transport system substrate-binding protein
MTPNSQHQYRSVTGISIGVGLVLSLGSCGINDRPNGAAQKKDIQITLAGYAIPKAAYSKILPKFAAKWQKEHNQKVIFRQTYGGSGSQTRAIADGLPADVVHLALGSDVDKLVSAGLLKSDWAKSLPNNSIVAQSVATIITRPGNPKKIVSFADLGRPDVKWVTADPKTSGGARWNVLALWHYALANGQNETQAIASLAQAYKNVSVSTKDSREATDAFIKQGQGDALLNYENEAILAKQKGLNLEYAVPEVNISIDTPIAIIDKNVEKHGNREVVKAFAQYLFQPEAQAEFTKLGFRPIASSTPTPTPDSRFPKIKTLGTIATYGGWKDFQQKFFADNGIYNQVRSK